jgi:phosphoribosyl-AMP cyclohydrolase/phosphoribosyl-ATP pyrophosphohydrolase/phosphoribosyl-AMP cyclohydrolase
MKLSLEKKLMMELKKYFEKSKLIPTVVQDAETGEVLMLAYMSEESLSKTIESGFTWFWSRSRNELWNKGATSGNTQKVIEIYTDCDLDTLLVKVQQKGDACHTGNRSCFFNKIDM